MTDCSRQRVLEALESPKLRTLYANTFYSLADRLDEAGYLEESYVPGRYPGDFARSSGAYVFLMAEAGEIDLAVRALRFVLDTMVRNRLTRPPHVMGKPRYGAGGKLCQELDMINQPDGTGHILSACAELILRYGRKELYEEYWPFMADMMDLHADQPYFFGNPICNFPVAKLHLFLNTAFEHSREGRYWCCFDLLTQSFLGASLEKMAAVARLYGQDYRAEPWEAVLRCLRDGIRRHLTVTEQGRTRYAELRLPDGNDGHLFDGMGWVSLSPIAAGWEALPGEVMHNTAQAVREKLWLPDPAGEGLYFLNKDTEEIPSLETIGKGLGWDMEEARRTGDFDHIGDILEFLMLRHEAALYGECMFYREGRWQTRDNGNAEQCIWWCWAMGRLRNDLGLPRLPDRVDITEAPVCVPAEFIEDSIGG